MIYIMLAAFLFSVAAAAFIYKKAKTKTNVPKVLLLLSSALVLALGAELTVFNVNFYNTRNYKEISLDRYLSGTENDEGVYELNSSKCFLVFNELNEDIKNLRFDLVYDTSSNINVEIRLTDDGNKYLFSAPQRSINPGVKKSQCINLHTKGVSSTISVKFLLGENQSIRLNGIKANVKRDFDFSFLRILIVLAALIFLYAFKPSSPLYKMKLGDNADIAKTLCSSAIILESALFIILASINPTFMGLAAKNYNEDRWSGKGITLTRLRYENANQYDQLAQAIIEKGVVYIDNDDVPQFLKDMDNPYDTTARSQEGAVAGQTARWDVAYYNGHYYVYFGIVPLLLMYLPFRLIFKAPFPTALGIAVFAILFSVGSYILLSFIAKKKFKGQSVGSFILVFLLFINCSGILFFSKRPDFYSLPIITAMTFSVFGIFLWLKALTEERHRRLRFFFGALLMALVAGCRPQITLLSLIALPIFWSFFFKEKHILKKDGILDLLSLAVPYITVAAGLMYYNAIRFSSPFDFGANYNLTTNDMTVRGFDFGRIGLGLFTYLFQLPAFSAIFPFIKPAAINTNYVGKTIYENCFGGIFATSPVLWALFLLPFVKDKLKEKKLFIFTIVPIIIGVTVVIVDTQGAGLLERYFGDFSFMFLFSAALVIFALYEKYSEKKEHNAQNALLFAASLFSAFYQFCLIFSVSDITINTQNPELFTYVSQMIQFWL